MNHAIQKYIDRLETQYYMVYPSQYKFRNAELDPFWEWINTRDFNIEDAFKRNLNPADIFGGSND